MLAASVTDAAVRLQRAGASWEPARDRPCVAAWLAHLGRTTRDLQAACVVHVPADDAAPSPVATWPASVPAEDRDLDFARRAVLAKRYMVESDATAAAVRLIALPLVLAGLPRHAVLVRLPRPAQASVSTDVKPLLQASAWLKLLLDAHRGRAPAPVPSPSPLPPALLAGPAPAREALDLFAATLQAGTLASAAAALVNQLATLLHASRATLGLLCNGELRVLAVSGSAGVGPLTALSAAVRGALEEAIRQDAVLCAPEESGMAPREEAAQRLLLREARCAAVCTLPFADGAGVVGAVTLEFPAGRVADAAQRERCRAALALAGPVLVALQRAEESPLRRLRAQQLARLRSVLGPRRPWLKLSGAALALLLLLAAVLPGAHKVAGDAVLRGSVQRVVLAPVDGYIATAQARPGDVVESGAVLATLDDESLALELAKWQAEYDRLVNEYRDAMSQLDSAKVGVLRAEIDRAAAEYQLAEENLARSQIRAPLAGVVVSGDFSQKIGAPVERGATLFELAPLEGYRISVRVPEGDVARVMPGQRGRLLLQSLPGMDLDIVVERVTPVAEVVNGRNVFEVEARLLGAAPEALRPGMQGVAKLEVGRARLLWLWTHRAFDWLRVQLWGLGSWS